MSELIEFLRARLDDDEAHAHKDIWAADQATQGDWRTRYGVNLPSSWVETESTPIARLDAAQHQADGLLIQRFKPDNVRARAQRMLREVEVKRQIVERAAQYGRWAVNEGTHAFQALASAGEMMLKLLALPYAGHADYREEWRP